LNRRSLVDRVGGGQLGVDLGEGRVELATDVADHRDDGDGNERGDQSVFDRGGALFVILDQLEKLHHVSSPERPARDRPLSSGHGGVSQRAVTVRAIA
jgi:hypothetical protein